MSIRVLLIEDHRALADTVTTYLELEGIECDYAATGTQGLHLAHSENHELILLDVGLPRMNGLQVCEALRMRGVDTPVLMLTARDSLQDKLAGFEAGTDDYLVKPFEMQELVARVKALAQRRSARARRLQVGTLVLDLSRGIASRENRQIALTPTGWKLLELLMRASPDVVSRDELRNGIWGTDETPDSDALKVHLHRLRQQVDQPFDQPLLHTIAGQGVAIRVAED